MPVPVQVNLNPDTRKVDQALARIRSQARNVDFGSGARSLNKLSQPLGRITGQATEFEKSLEASNARVLAFGASVAVINKLSQAFSSLVSNTIKVEATFAKINTVLGGTEKQIQQFGRSIFQVAKDTGTSFDQVAEGALELARQGLSAQESINRISTALKLVRVTGIDAEKAVGGLTAAIKGFEGSGLTVAQIADKLSQADVKFAVSTEDLIDGLQRASASARVAGVSFDELLASITVVQERTQRGGAVIGNAFKTIFSYIARPETINYLESLGIQVVDAQGRVRDAIPIIKDLGKYLEKTGMQSATAATVIQKVAGVRQRDILINLIEDLNSGQSQFNKALMETGSSVGSLDAKQKALNNTLEYFISRTVTAGQEFAAMLGKIGFTDAAKSILDSLSSALEGVTDLLDGESIGSKFAQGLVRGIGGILTGPGLILVGGIFVKLFVDLAKFGMTSLKNLLGINRASQEQQALQKSIFQTLVSNEAIQREILLLGNNKVAQAKLLTKVYNDQIKALTTIQSISSRVAPTLLAGGLRGGVGGVTRRRGGTAAGGYISEEASAISRGVGGAPTSAKVAVIPNFAFGRGERGTMVANTSEYYVPNYAGGGDAIFNQNMVRSMGLPKGAMKINAAGGYVPNYAKPSISIGKAGITSAETAIKAGYTRSQISQAFGKKESDRLFGAAKAKGLTSTKGKKKITQLTLDATGKIGLASLFKESLASQTTTSLSTLSPVEREKSMKLVNTYANAMGEQNALNSVKLQGIEVRSLEDYKNGIKNAKELRSGLKDIFAPSLVNFGAQLLGKTIDSDEAQKAITQIKKDSKDRRLFSTSVEGGLFESAISLITNGIKSIPEFKSNKDDGVPFDFSENKSLTDTVGKRFKEVFGFSNSIIKVDAKRTSSQKAISSLIGKTLRDPQALGATSKMYAASGYIPNFAQSPLEDAIGREQAAGVPINQIRVNQSGKLRNAQNPMGLAVTNTRDEPTGAIPNYAVYNDVAAAKAGGLSDKQILAGFGGKGLKDEMEKLAKATKVQTEASKTQTKATVDNTGKFLLLSMASQGITSAFGNVENKAAQLALGLANSAVQFGFYHSMVKDAFTNFSKSLRKQSMAMAVGAGARGGAAGAALGMGARVLGGAARALPVAGTVLSLGLAFAPLIMDITKTKDAFSDLRKEIEDLDPNALIAGNKEEIGKIVANLNIAADRARSYREATGSNITAANQTDVKDAFIENQKEEIRRLFTPVSSSAMAAEKATITSSLVDLATGIFESPEEKAISYNRGGGRSVISDPTIRSALEEASVFPEIRDNLEQIANRYKEEIAKGTLENIEDHYAFVAKIIEEYTLPKRKGDIQKAPDEKILAKDALSRVRDTYSKAGYESQLKYLGISDPKDGVSPVSVGSMPEAKKGSLEYYKNRLTYEALSAEKALEIQQSIEDINFEHEKTNKLREAEKGIVEKSLTINGEYTALDEGKFKILQNLIAGQHTFEELKTAIADLTGKEVDLTKEQYEELLRNRSVLEGELGISEQLLKNEQARARDALKRQQLEQKISNSISRAYESRIFGSKLETFGLERAEGGGYTLSTPTDKKSQQSILQLERELALTSLTAEERMDIEHSLATLNQEQSNREQLLKAEAEILSQSVRLIMDKTKLEENEAAVIAQMIKDRKTVGEIQIGMMGILRKDPIDVSRDLRAYVDGFSESNNKQKYFEKIQERILELTKGMVDLTDEQAEAFAQQLVDAEARGQLEAESLKVNQKIQKIQFDKITLTDEEIQQIQERYNLESDELEFLLKVLKIRQEIAKKSLEPKGFAESLKGSAQRLSEQQGLRMLGDTLGERIPNQFADGMATAFNNLATGAYDSIGGVFGQLALDFGTMIMQEINKAVAAEIASSIMKGSFVEGIGNWFKGVIGFASGGYISQGSGVKDDVPAMLMGGEYVVRKAAVQKYGVNFLESLNQGQVQGYADGGVVQGARNFYKAKYFWEDPEGNMMGGAASNARLARAKQTDFFMPGYRGAGAIIGKENLLAFAMQGTTSGATDTFSRRGTGFSFDTELQSANLSGIGRIRAMESPVGQGLMSAKQQAFDLYTQRISEEQRVFQAKKDAEQARSETFKKAVIGAAITSVAAGIAGKLKTDAAPDATSSSGPSLQDDLYTTKWVPPTPTEVNPPGGWANGGLFRGMRSFANGGAANAMLMGGEYVVSPQSTSMVGKSMLDDINNMRYPMPAFANGGARGAAPMKSGSSSGSADIGELNININIEKSGNASVDSSMSSDSSGDAQQSKEFAKKIKDVVVKVIQEEKRVSGSLFTRNK